MRYRMDAIAGAVPGKVRIKMAKMTENEAIEELKYDCNELGKAIPCDTSWGKSFENAYAMAIKALEEVQQYQAIGTHEECQTAMELYKEMHKRKFTLEDVEEYMKFEDECVRKNFTFKSLLESREKQTPKKPDLEGDGYGDDVVLIYDTWICPCCGKRYEIDYEEYNYCPNCGQAIDWSVRNEDTD